MPPISIRTIRFPVSILGEQPEPDLQPGVDHRDRARGLATTITTCGRCGGVGLAGRRQLAMILGCESAGVDADGREVIVHSVICDPAWLGDETLDPRRSLLSERHPGTFAERVAVPCAQPRAETGGALLGAGSVSADGVADGVPDALHPRTCRARDDGAGAGCRRRCGDGADRAGTRRGAAGVGHEPLGGQAGAGRSRSAPTRPSSRGRGCRSGSTR